MSNIKPATTANELLARLAKWEAMDDRALVCARDEIRAEQTIDWVNTSYGVHGFRPRLWALEPTCEAEAPAPARPEDDQASQIRGRYLTLSARLRAADEASRIRRQVGKSGGRGKVATNALAGQKAHAKREALLLWEERRAGLHPRLRTVVHFATEVMHRWPVLTSQKVIERWSASWSKAVREGRDPLC